MTTQHRPEHAAPHGPANNQQTHHSDKVDSRTASELALNAKDQHNVQNSIAHRSLILAMGNALAHRVEFRPQGNLDPYSKMVTLMREQATHIKKIRVEHGADAGC